MTQYLAEAAREVVAVEIDKTLIPILENDTLKDWDNVTVINEDILKVDIAALAQEKNGGKPIKVVANLPYYITTPLIAKLLDESELCEGVSVMVQEEVAERFCAKENTPEYGAITAGIALKGTAKIVKRVPRTLFYPRPQDPPKQSDDQFFPFPRAGERGASKGGRRRKSARGNAFSGKAGGAF